MGDRNLQVAPPRKGQIQRITVSTTGANTALDPAVLGVGWVRVKAITANVQFYFSKLDTDVVTLNAATGNECGYSLLAGQSEDYYLTNETRFVWDADAAGTIEIFRSGVERAGKR